MLHINMMRFMMFVSFCFPVETSYFNLSILHLLNKKQ